MATVTPSYTYDRTGHSRSNLIIAETHDLSNATSRLVVANQGLYYTTSLVVTRVSDNSVLVLNTDYTYQGFDEVITAMTGSECCAAIALINDSITGSINLQYQCVGGIQGGVNGLVNDLRNQVAYYNSLGVSWSAVQNKPSTYPPAAHQHNILTDLTSLEALRNALEDITSALTNSRPLTLAGVALQSRIDGIAALIANQRNDFNKLSANLTQVLGISSTGTISESLNTIVSSAMSNYVTSTQLTNATSNLVTTTALTTALSSYTPTGGSTDIAASTVATNAPTSISDSDLLPLVDVSNDNALSNITIGNIKTDIYNSLSATSNGVEVTVSTTGAVSAASTIDGLMYGVSSNGNIKQAVAGTDYQSPITLDTSTTSGPATYDSAIAKLTIPTYIPAGQTAFTTNGGTLTGPLTLHANGINSLDAVTVQQLTAANSSLYRIQGTYTVNGAVSYPTSANTVGDVALASGMVWIVSGTGGSISGNTVSSGDTVTCTGVDGSGNATWVITLHSIGYTPENQANKNQSNGYVGLNGYDITISNSVSGTLYTNYITGIATQSGLTYKLPNKSITFAGLEDLSNLVNSSSVTGAITSGSDKSSYLSTDKFPLIDTKNNSTALGYTTWGELSSQINALIDSEAVAAVNTALTASSSNNLQTNIGTFISSQISTGLGNQSIKLTNTDGSLVNYSAGMLGKYLQSFATIVSLSSYALSTTTGSTTDLTTAVTSTIATGTPVTLAQAINGVASTVATISTEVSTLQTTVNSLSTTTSTTTSSSSTTKDLQVDYGLVAITPGYYSGTQSIVTNLTNYQTSANYPSWTKNTSYTRYSIVVGGSYLWIANVTAYGTTGYISGSSWTSGNSITWPSNVTDGTTTVTDGSITWTIMTGAGGFNITTQQLSDIAITNAKNLSKALASSGNNGTSIFVPDGNFWINAATLLTNTSANKLDIDILRIRAAKSFSLFGNGNSSTITLVGATGSNGITIIPEDGNVTIRCHDLSIIGGMYPAPASPGWNALSNGWLGAGSSGIVNNGISVLAPFSMVYTGNTRGRPTTPINSVSLNSDNVTATVTLAFPHEFSIIGRLVNITGIKNTGTSVQTKTFNYNGSTSDTYTTYTAAYTKLQQVYLRVYGSSNITITKNGVATTLTAMPDYNSGLAAGDVITYSDYSCPYNSDVIGTSYSIPGVIATPVIAKFIKGTTTGHLATDFNTFITNYMAVAAKYRDYPAVYLNGGFIGSVADFIIGGLNNSTTSYAAMSNGDVITYISDPYSYTFKLSATQLAAPRPTSITCAMASSTAWGSVGVGGTQAIIERINFNSVLSPWYQINPPTSLGGSATTQPTASITTAVHVKNIPYSKVNDIWTNGSSPNATQYDSVNSVALYSDNMCTGGIYSNINCTGYDGVILAGSSSISKIISAIYTPAVGSASAYITVTYDNIGHRLNMDSTPDGNGNYHCMTSGFIPTAFNTVYKDSSSNMQYYSTLTVIDPYTVKVTLTNPLAASMASGQSAIFPNVGDVYVLMYVLDDYLTSVKTPVKQWIALGTLYSEYSEGLAIANVVGAGSNYGIVVNYQTGSDSINISNCNINTNINSLYITWMSGGWISNSIFWKEPGSSNSFNGIYIAGGGLMTLSHISASGNSASNAYDAGVCYGEWSSRVRLLSDTDLTASNYLTVTDVNNRNYSGVGANIINDITTSQLDVDMLIITPTDIKDIVYDGTLYTTAAGTIVYAASTANNTLHGLNASITKPYHVAMASPLSESNIITSNAKYRFDTLTLNNKNLQIPAVAPSSIKQYSVIAWDTSNDTRSPYVNRYTHFINDGSMAYTAPVSNTIALGSLVVGVNYTIKSLNSGTGSVTQAQWNTIAGTSGVTYAANSTFTAATNGTLSGITAKPSIYTTLILTNYMGIFSYAINTYPSTGGSGTSGAINKGDFWLVNVVTSTTNTWNIYNALVNNPGQSAANWAIVVSGYMTVSCGTNHSLSSGQYVTVSNASNSSGVSIGNGTYPVWVTSGTSFTYLYNYVGSNIAGCSVNNSSIILSAAIKSMSSVTAGNTSTVTVTLKDNTFVDTISAATLTTYSGSGFTWTGSTTNTLPTNGGSGYADGSHKGITLFSASGTVTADLLVYDKQVTRVYVANANTIVSGALYSIQTATDVPAASSILTITTNNGYNNPNTSVILSDTGNATFNGTYTATWISATAFSITFPSSVTTKPSSALTATITTPYPLSTATTTSGSYNISNVQLSGFTGTNITLNSIGLIANGVVLATVVNANTFTFTSNTAINISTGDATLGYISQPTVFCINDSYSGEYNFGASVAWSPDLTSGQSTGNRRLAIVQTRSSAKTIIAESMAPAMNNTTTLQGGTMTWLGTAADASAYNALYNSYHNATLYPNCSVTFYSNIGGTISTISSPATSYAGISTKPAAGAIYYYNVTTYSDITVQTVNSQPITVLPGDIFELYVYHDSTNALDIVMDGGSTAIAFTSDGSTTTTETIGNTSAAVTRKSTYFTITPSFTG